MDTLPKVTVITRTKNRPVFLERAIKSVKLQSYQNYMHVIVNDGGDPEQLEGIVKKQNDTVRSKIKIFHRDKSSNAPDTIFNESIDRLDSEYFAIHDDDDTWHSDFLKNTIERLDENPSLGAVVVRTDKILEVEANSTIREIKRTQLMPSLKVVSLYRQCIDNQLTPIATLYRRSAYSAIGKFDSSLPVVGDWEYGVRLLQKYDVDYIDLGYALAYYHHRKYVAGSPGNSSFTGDYSHRYYTNLVMNRNLRDELASGRLGVGFIMSQLKYNQMYIGSLLGRFLPTTILNRIKRRARD